MLPNGKYRFNGFTIEERDLVGNLFKPVITIKIMHVTDTNATDFRYAKYSQLKRGKKYKIIDTNMSRDRLCDIRNQVYREVKSVYLIYEQIIRDINKIIIPNKLLTEHVSTYHGFEIYLCVNRHRLIYITDTQYNFTENLLVLQDTQNGYFIYDKTMPDHRILYLISLFKK